MDEFADMFRVYAAELTFGDGHCEAWQADAEKGELLAAFRRQEDADDYADMMEEVGERVIVVPPNDPELEVRKKLGRPVSSTGLSLESVESVSLIVGQMPC